jgi:predicted Zn-dependent protease
MYFGKLIRSVIAAFLGIIVVCTPNAFPITIYQEDQLSQEFMEAVLSHYDIVRDPLISNYVNLVGHQILSHMSPQPFDFRFYVIKENTYNAFAGPGGVIFIHSGLFEIMDNEDELAGILSHEISHVVHRHISERIEKSKTIGLVTLAGIAAAILAGVGGVGVATEALTVGTMAAGQSLSLAYSREDEMEADTTGYKFLIDAGYSGEGLLSILKKMRDKEWYGSDQIPTYMMTHPALEERMIYLGARLNEKGESNPLPEKEKSERFQWAHTKLLAMFGEKDAMVDRFNHAVKAMPEDAAAQYGYGLVLERTGHLNDSVDHLKIALAKEAFNPNILIDLGRVCYMNGQYDESFKVLKSALSITPENPEGRLYLGRTQIALEKYNDAIDTLVSIPEKNPFYTDVYYYLGEAYGKLEKTAKSHMNLGIYYQKNRDFKNAAFHFNRALQSSDEPAEKRHIQQMLDDIQEKIHQQNRQPKAR